jgi:adenylate cyclase
MALRDRDKIRGVLNKVVSKEISEEILKGRIELGGEERTITILFSDIRGFTHLSENLDPRLLIGMLNDYMTQMCRIIDETHGVVDKFVGDEIMALYGAPLQLEQHAVLAIEAARRKIACLRQWNEKRKLEGQVPFEIGIGIHTGLVLAGNMGAENRLNYTVIGANVNLASRLCSQAKRMQVIVSEETWKEPGVQEKFRFKELEPLTLKGIDVPVKAYELIFEDELASS